MIPNPKFNLGDRIVVVQSYYSDLKGKSFKIIGRAYSLDCTPDRIHSLSTWMYLIDSQAKEPGIYGSAYQELKASCHLNPDTLQ